MSIEKLQWSIYEDDAQFVQCELQFDENNPSCKTITFVNDSLLKTYNIKLFSYYLLNNQKLVCLFGSPTVPLNQILISQVVSASLQLTNSNSIITIDFTKPIPIREYDQSSLYNFLPNIPLCQRIIVSNVWNQNSNLFECNLISELIQEVFYVQIGDIIALNISLIKDISKFTQDKKKLQKLIKYKLTKINNVNNICLYENSKRMLILRVENILVFGGKSGRELIPFYIDKENSKFTAFIVDLKRDTNVKLDMNRSNISPIFPIIRDQRAQQYKSFIENEIISSEIYTPFLNSVQKILKYSFQKHSSLLLIAPKGSGKRLILRKICEVQGLNYIEKDVKKSGGVGQLERIVMKGVNIRPCLIHIRNLRSLTHIMQHKTQEDPERLVVRNVQELINKFQELEKGICEQPKKCVLVFSMDKFDDSSLSDNNLKNVFSDYFILNKPSNVNSYLNMIKFHSQLHQQQDSFFDEKYTKELENLLRIAIGLPLFTFEKALKNCIQASPPEKICTSLVEKLEGLRKSGDIESLSIPNVKWEDVGGLQDAKNEIIDTIMLPQLYPQIFDEFVRPRTGLLFFGPPGTGKTLLAKCIATETKMNFLSVKGPELLNMYIGESEKNVRDIFANGRRNQPCVIFFDELDALAPNRGNGSDSSQVMDRIVAQFLTELDDINKEGASIFVVGATNRPDLLDQGLLRPGRFDKLIYLGINSDFETRLKILQAQTRKLKLESSVDFSSLLEKIPKNFTGADFYGLTSQTVLKAARRKIKEIESIYQQRKKENGENYSFNTFSEEIITSMKELREVTVGMQDFEEALYKITPSVSEQELVKYQELKNKFQ